MKTFDELYAELYRKTTYRDEETGTQKLVDAGVHAVGKKVVEEAAEAWMAAEYEGHDRTAEERASMLRVAVPNKGQLAEPARSMLAEAGYLRAASTRDLVVHDPDNDVEFFFLRPRDIAIYVGEGTLDIGITGRDMLLDSGAKADEILSLGFAPSTFRLAAPVGRATSEALIIRRTGAPQVPAVETFVRRLHGVMVARSYVLVDYDIRTEHLEVACSLTPGIESPTVSSLHDPAWSAVRAMVPALDVHRVMDELYDLGARGILVTDIHACRL